MTRRRIVGIGVAAAAAVAVVGVTMVRAQTDAEPPASSTRYKPVARIKDLMRINGQYNRELRQNLVGTVDWDEAVFRANIMAEIGNIMAFYKPAKERKWHEAADSLKSVSLDLVKACEKKDKELARTVYSRLGESCSMCHAEYRRSSEKSEKKE